MFLLDSNERRIYRSAPSHDRISKYSLDFRRFRRMLAESLFNSPTCVRYSDNSVGPIGIKPLDAYGWVRKFVSVLNRPAVGTTLIAV